MNSVNELSLIKDLLWNDDQVFDHRYQKASAALIAIYRVLDSESSLGDTKSIFLKDYQSFELFSESNRDRVTRDPYFYFWTRLAFELVYTVINDKPPPSVARKYCEKIGVAPRDALQWHLNDFKRLLIGLSVIEGSDLEFETPLKVSLPLAIPGTRLSLLGDEQVSILALENGRLISDSGALKASSCPMVEFGGCYIRLQPSVFNVPLDNISELIYNTPYEYEIQHKGRLESALKVLARVFPSGFSQFRRVINTIAIRPASVNGPTFNMSHCDLPGAIAVFPYSQPYEFANLLLHEFYHNRLFMIEEKGLFLRESSDEPAKRYYSPWRSDRRPLHGILHATYVFTGIGRYWLLVLGDEKTDDSIKKIAASRVMSSLKQVQIGAEQLRRFAHFTSFGQSVFDQLTRDIDQLEIDARRTALSYETPFVFFDEDDELRQTNHVYRPTKPQTVIEKIMDHVQKYGNQDDQARLEEIVKSSKWAVQ